MDVAVGIADSQDGVASGQALHPHPTAVALARSQPACSRNRAGDRFEKKWGGGEEEAKGKDMQ